jgi:ribonuclease HI
MEVAPIHIYCDASFSQKRQMALSGYLLLEGDDSHIDPDSPQPVQTEIFRETNNVRAELRGVIFALESLIEGKCAIKADRPIILYTDCQTIVSLLGRRQRLESSNFVSKRTKMELSNAQLYRQFYGLYDRLNLTIIWVKGHSPKSGRNNSTENFSYVDKVVRKKLRDFCRGLP